MFDTLAHYKILDRIGAGADGSPHAFGRRAVDRGRAPGIVRGVHGRFHLGGGERRAAVLAGTPAIVAIELHDIGAGRHLATHGANYVIDAAGKIVAVDPEKPQDQVLKLLSDEREGGLIPPAPAPTSR